MIVCERALQVLDWAIRSEYNPGSAGIPACNSQHIFMIVYERALMTFAQSQNPLISGLMLCPYTMIVSQHILRLLDNMLLHVPVEIDEICAVSCHSD